MLYILNTFIYNPVAFNLVRLVHCHCTKLVTIAKYAVPRVATLALSANI